jgi:cysteine desulfurase family protein
MGWVTKGLRRTIKIEEIQDFFADCKEGSLIYFDNASTTYPKPPEVVKAIADFLVRVGGSPARGSHRRSLEASRIVYDARELVADLVGIRDPLRVVFMANCTTAINIALRAFLSPGDHVVTTSVEHNAVMRALRCLEKEGVSVSLVQSDSQGFVQPNDIKSEIRSNTRLVVINHASNVLGSIQPVTEIGRVCREAGVLLLLDSAQTLGCVPFDMCKCQVDLLAFSGHKSLYGPQGVGGLIIGEHVNLSDINPVICGGTGSYSESEDQPTFLPDMLESGTLNGPGIAGLKAGVEFVLSIGVEAIRQHESRLIRLLIEGLSEIKRVVVYGAENLDNRAPIVSFNISDKDPVGVAHELEERFGILCRAGLHCAPTAHKTTGTFPKGSIRFSLGWFNTKEDVELAVKAVRELAS